MRAGGCGWEWVWIGGGSRRSGRGARGVCREGIVGRDSASAAARGRSDQGVVFWDWADCGARYFHSCLLCVCGCVGGGQVVIKLRIA